VPKRSLPQPSVAPALDGAPLVWTKASNAKVGTTVKRTGFDAVDLLSKKQPPETTQERLMEP